MLNELPPDNLRKVCDARFIRCKTTEELAPLREIIGQERAVRALKFGLGIRDRGFNIYVAGFPGTGRTTASRQRCSRRAPATQETRAGRGFHPRSRRQ